MKTINHFYVSRFHLYVKASEEADIYEIKLREASVGWWKKMNGFPRHTPSHRRPGNRFVCLCVQVWWWGWGGVRYSSYFSLNAFSFLFYLFISFSRWILLFLSISACSVFIAVFTLRRHSNYSALLTIILFTLSDYFPVLSSRLFIPFSFSLTWIF